MEKVYCIFNQTIRMWQSAAKPNDFVKYVTEAKDWNTQQDAEKEIQRLKQLYPTHKFKVEPMLKGE